MPGTTKGTKDIYYLSFAGDEGFRGVCLVRAKDSIDAVRVAHRLGINPGGQVMMVLVPQENYDRAPKKLPFNRLMDKATLIELGGPVDTLTEARAKGRID